jgi:hypothetical protein
MPNLDNYHTQTEPNQPAVTSRCFSLKAELQWRSKLLRTDKFMHILHGTWLIERQQFVYGVKIPPPGHSIEKGGVGEQHRPLCAVEQ